MAGIFDSLYTAYSGLQVSQVAVNVTSNNVSNASNENYTRQRVTIQAKSPMKTQPGDIGTGAEVFNVTRIHDEYVYKRLNAASTQSQFTDFEETTLTEVSKYFPDIGKQGIAKYIQNYFDSWQKYANNPSDSNLATAVSENAQNLSNAVKDTKDMLSHLQTSLNDRIPPIVDEINRLAKEIADINQQITMHEANGTSKANDLRDQRDARETALSKLMNMTVSKNGVKTDMMVDSAVADGSNQYVIQVGGYPLVDGATYHPLVLKTDPNSSSQQLNGVFFQYQDYREIDISDKINSGELGAIMDLRGTDTDSTGKPIKGKIQEYMDKLDSFSKTFIESMNDTYAGSAVGSMYSNNVNALGTETLATLPVNIKSGTFDIVAYDTNGTEVSRRSISVDINTDTLNSLAAKINVAQDDNKDGNATNDMNSYFNAFFNSGTQGQFSISSAAATTGLGYTVALEDSKTNPSNFAGALGLGRLFDGNNASNMALSTTFTQTLASSTLIHPYSANIQGNNTVANRILQLQYDKQEFTLRDGSTVMNTLSGFYADTATKVGSDTETAVMSNDTAKATYAAVSSEFTAISKVSTDEEMVNLMKFQAGYSASAKVVTTIDQMINTLLGIKQ
jgi:flagellar hook-associated protein 1